MLGGGGGVKRGVDWLVSLAPAMTERLHIGVGASSVVDPVSRSVDSDMGVVSSLSLTSTGALPVVLLTKSACNVEREYVMIGMYSG